MGEDWAGGGEAPFVQRPTGDRVEGGMAEMREEAAVRRLERDRLRDAERERERVRVRNICM